jgi:hypothetical protein
MKTRHVIAIALATVLTASAAAYAERAEDFQAPRGQDLQAPRTHDEIQAPRGQDQQAPRQ